jgi:hypothetical protein
MYNKKIRQLEAKREQYVNYTTRQAVNSAASQFPELIHKERHETYLG